ncbi:MAG: diphosphomevalonate decarboxylase [Polyangiales bacterium]
MSTATAIARANIALAKYWGKSDVPLNLPAVASISLTLEPMRTETTVSFDSRLDADELLLNGKRGEGKPLTRAIKVLDRVRKHAGIDLKARVESANNFPTASGLASSASGFAALVAAAWSAAGLKRDDDVWSAWARNASASAARSIYGGFVELPKGVPGDAALSARTVAPADHWDVRIVVAVANEGPKDTGSTEGMTLSEQTSPYYRSWVDCSDALVEEVRAGILERNLVKVGEAMEQSTLAMHACMMASRPGLIYFQPATLAALATVKQLRKEGVEVYATMDAGPHVKALCHARDAERVAAALAATPMVLRTLTAHPGGALEIVK